ncbi:MAG: ribonuclease HI [Chlamydiales bacterium]|jgi:ribonuclease HI
MPSFKCQTCNAPFDVSKGALAKYPGWKPRYCREHSPKQRKRSGSTREENLTLAQVLEKYRDGPQDGVFTDGSSVPNPGPGGWGAVWVEDGEVRAQAHGQDSQTTNNRMELKALIEAYRMLPEDSDVTLLSDSRLCVDTINKWAPGWEKKGWKKKNGEIKNLELVQELLGLHRAHPKCSIGWIAAHSGNRWNEYADSLASAWQRVEL